MERMLFIPSPDTTDHGIRCSISQAVTITGRSRRTVQRWVRRRQISDPLALQLLQANLYGRLPPPWNSWRVSGHVLVSPTGDSFTTGDLRAAYVNAELVRHLRARVQDLERQLARERRTPMGRIRQAAGALVGPARGR